MQNSQPNKPYYLYEMPMFMITVSVVVLQENGVLMCLENGVWKFPGGIVKAGQETIQFAAIRYLKEQIYLTLNKETLIPVDFRSNPERSKEGNVVDIGMTCDINDKKHTGTWKEIDFENKCLIDKTLEVYMDHAVLLERAIEINMIIR